MATQTATCARIFSARRGGGKKQTTTTNKTTTFSRSSRNKTRTAVTTTTTPKRKRKTWQVGVHRPIYRWGQGFFHHSTSRRWNRILRTTSESRTSETKKTKTSTPHQDLAFFLPCQIWRVVGRNTQALVVKGPTINDVRCSHRRRQSFDRVAIERSRHKQKS